VSTVTLTILPVKALFPCGESVHTAVSPSTPTSTPSSPENAYGCVFAMCPKALRGRRYRFRYSNSLIAAFSP
jgi:hypothetical protein